MVFNKDDLGLIKSLGQEKHDGGKSFLKNEFPNRNGSMAALERLIARIDATESAEKRNGLSRNMKSWLHSGYFYRSHGQN